MKNQVQQQPISSHDAPLESTCPIPVVETQIPTTSVTQTSPVQDVKVYSYVFTFNHYNGHKLKFLFIYTIEPL